MALRNLCISSKENQMTIIKDLGMEYPKTKSRGKQRYGIYECPACKKHLKLETSSVKSGRSTKCKSCSSRKHGKHNTRLYTIWGGMKDRCFNENSTAYKYYGERGIVVCDEWINDFEKFYMWAMRHGYKNNLTIDRRNNDKGYY